MSGIKEIDDYIAAFPPHVQQRLTKIRNLISDLAPEAVEKISYQMPTFYLQGNLVHFAGYAKHIGLYPAPSGIEEFKEDLAPYKHAKGSVQFAHTEPLPLELITKIVKFRVKENMSRNQK